MENPNLFQFKLALAQHLTEIYQNLPNPQENAQATSYDSLNKRFQKVYGEEPQFFIRCPGLIQLMGEEVSISSYSNLTMCTDQDIVIAYSKSNKQELVINNVMQTMYP